MDSKLFIENLKDRVFRPVEQFPIAVVEETRGRLVILVDTILRIELTRDGNDFFFQEFIEGGMKLANRTRFKTCLELEDHCVEAIQAYQRLLPLRLSSIK